MGMHGGSFMIISFSTKHIVIQDHIFRPHRFSKDPTLEDPKRVLDWPEFLAAINCPQGESSKFSHVKFNFILLNPIIAYWWASYCPQIFT